jgi:AmmeMemoRadiSam system protein B/AmmeMemoRadiSam system protein A
MASRGVWRGGDGVPKRRAILLLAAATLLPIVRPGARGAAVPPPGDEGFIRPPAVSGQFYPGNPSQLDGAVRSLLAEALPPRGERPIALIAPHAGYPFSGPIAADAFRQAAGYAYDLVVILGTNHTTEPFDGVSVFQGAGYRTPLGVVPVDQEAARALAKADPGFAYRPEADAREHSVEVQLPFVQILFPKAKIVAAVVGEADPALAARFGHALARVLKGRNALIVASSDLSHYPDQADAEVVNRRTLEAAATLDPAALTAAIRRSMGEGRPGLFTCACGEGPILAAMTAARDLGARRGIVVSYANSGHTLFGEPTRVVGYGAVIFTAGEGKPDTSALEAPPASGSAALTAADEQTLLHLARTTLSQFLRTGTVPLPRLTSRALAAPRGAFVTLEENGALRGCIGSTAAHSPLALTVVRMALEAALHDARFPPVRAAELPRLQIEISVLTPLVKVTDPCAIVVGRDGVVIRKDGRSAVFLPQVAAEQGWGREELLDNLCRKAGLPRDAWRSGAEFLTFQATVFGEGTRH